MASDLIDQLRHPGLRVGLGLGQAHEQEGLMILVESGQDVSLDVIEVQNGRISHVRTLLVGQYS